MNKDAESGEGRGDGEVASGSNGNVKFDMPRVVILV